MQTDRLDIPRFLPTSRLLPLRQVSAACAELGLRAHLVGGFVRDALLARPVNDLDIVIEGDAAKLGRALVKRHGGRVTVHAAFQTATWFVENDFIDFISARSETYARPAALPTVKPGSLEDDLRRRDFTVNALAASLDEERFGELTDPLGGRGDLERKLIRVLHPQSFADDPTRLFRAVRYAARYGFAIAPETEALIPGALQYVDQLSPERLRHELDLILDEEDPAATMEKLRAYGIDRAARPALPLDEATRARFQRARALPSEVNQNHLLWAVWLLDSSEAEIRAFDKRLHFTADLLKKIRAAAAIFRELDSFDGLRPSECVKRLEKIPEDSILAARLCAPRGEARAALETYSTKWKNVKPIATGETLLKMGVPFGPRIGEILWRLRAAWLDGNITSAAEEKTALAKLIEKKKS